MSFTTYIIPESNKKQTESSGKKLWVITKHPLTIEHDDLLQKICQPLKAVYPADVYHLIHNSSEPVSIEAYSYLGIALIISFGIKPTDLGIFIDLDSPGIRHLESFSFILSSSLDDLLKQPSAKKQLWTSMQSFMKQSEIK
jgi:hypothetical protein